MYEFSGDDGNSGNKDGDGRPGLDDDNSLILGKHSGLSSILGKESSSRGEPSLILGKESSSTGWPLRLVTFSGVLSLILGKESSSGGPSLILGKESSLGGPSLILGKESLLGGSSSILGKESSLGESSLILGKESLSIGRLGWRAGSVGDGNGNVSIPASVGDAAV